MDPVPSQQRDLTVPLSEFSVGGCHVPEAPCGTQSCANCGCLQRWAWEPLNWQQLTDQEATGFRKEGKSGACLWQGSPRGERGVTAFLTATLRPCLPGWLASWLFSWEKGVQALALARDGCGSFPATCQLCDLGQDSCP